MPASTPAPFRSKPPDLSRPAASETSAPAFSPPAKPPGAKARTKVAKQCGARGVDFASLCDLCVTNPKSEDVGKTTYTRSTINPRASGASSPTSTAARSAASALAACATPLLRLTPPARPRPAWSGAFPAGRIHCAPALRRVGDLVVRVVANDRIRPVTPKTLVRHVRARRLVPHQRRDRRAAVQPRRAQRSRLPIVARPLVLVPCQHASDPLPPHVPRFAIPLEKASKVGVGHPVHRLPLKRIPDRHHRVRLPVDLPPAAPSRRARKGVTFDRSTYGVVFRNRMLST